MKHNDTNFDLLRRYQASSYCSGEKLRCRAQDIKLELLSKFHSLFCQEVNKQWLVMPGRRCGRRPRMYAHSFIAIPASISALVISPPPLFKFRTHASAMHVLTLTIRRARPHSRKRTIHVRTLTIARAQLRKQLYLLYLQATQDTGDGGDGEDGEGAGTGAT